MARALTKPHDAPWLEPVAAAVLLALSLFVNRFEPWPWMWVVDVAACTGAALARRRPAIASVLTGLALAFWLPFPQALPSVSGIAFYINIFAATRANLSWKVPLTLGFGGLAYLTLVRNAIEATIEYRWTTAILLLIALAVAYGGGTAFRYAAHRLQAEQDSGQARIQDLQSALARELHDSVAQTLSSAAMRANIIMGDPSLSPLAQSQLERIAEDCRSSAHDLRQLLSALRDQPERATPPGPLADVESLRTTVHDQAERLRAEGFTVDDLVEVTKLSAARCQTLAAITVEATNNIIKHARPGSSCSFLIEQCSQNVVGEFTNERRISRAARQGFGLTGVQERLALLNGTSEAEVKGNRWVLRVTLPLGLESEPGTPSPTAAAETVFSEPGAS